MGVPEARETGVSLPLRGAPAGAVFWGLLLALYLAARLPWLSSIPGYAYDEGLMGLVAKNWVRAGDPLQGGNLDLLRFPLFSTLLAGAYALFGPAILVSRALSVAAGLASLFVFARIARRLLSAEAARYALLLFTVDFVLVRYQRYGLAESVQILLLLSTVALWLRPRSSGFLRGLALGAAILQKPTSLALVPALIWIDGHAGRPGRLRAYLLAAGLTAAVHGGMLAAWPDRFAGAWGIYLDRGPAASELARILGALPRTLGVLCAGSPLAALGVLSVASGMRARRVRRRTDREALSDPADGILAAWLAPGLLLLALAPVVRYQAALLPPALLAGGRVAAALASRLAKAPAPGRTTKPPEARRDGKARLAFATSIALYSVALFVVYHFILGQRDDTGRRVAAWFESHGEATCTVLGFPQLGVDLPQAYFDAPSANALVPSAETLARLRIDYVVYDDAEWRALSEAKGWGVEDTLRALGSLRARVAGAEIWRLESLGTGERLAASARAAEGKE